MFELVGEGVANEELENVERDFPIGMPLDVGIYRDAENRRDEDGLPRRSKKFDEHFRGLWDRAVRESVIKNLRGS